MALEYYKGAELPDAQITWLDSAGDIINFSSGYTFVVKIGNPGSAAIVTKSAGITGAATAPNVVVSWATNELASIAAGSYSMNIIATQTATTKDRIQSTPISILEVVT